VQSALDPNLDSQGWRPVSGKKSASVLNDEARNVLNLLWPQDYEVRQAVIP
jgi:hypothetical protein